MDEPNEVTRTAPERIWLQISDDVDHRDEPYPSGEEVTWCSDSVMCCEVAYVRADLLAAMTAERDDLRDMVREAVEILDAAPGLPLEEPPLDEAYLAKWTDAIMGVLIVLTPAMDEARAATAAIAASAKVEA